MVDELQQFGLISARTVVGGTQYFDATALAVARAAAGFARHGVEARHLRAWRNAADREAGCSSRWSCRCCASATPRPASRRPPP